MITTIEQLIKEEYPRIESLVIAAMKAHPKRRGELKAEYIRRIRLIVDQEAWK